MWWNSLCNYAGGGMTTIHVALIQQKNTASQKTNLDNTVEKIIDAATDGSQLILLQELHTTLYPAQDQDAKKFSWAETIPGPTSNTLAALSKKLNIIIVASLFEKASNGIYYNTAVVFEKGDIKGKYRKMHIPDGPFYHEKFYFTPGDQGFKPIKTSVGNLGVLICWDQWFPEAARMMALNGADLLLYPTAIGWDNNDPQDEKRQQLDAWETVQRSHAIANILPVMSCNRVGFEAHPTKHNAGITFWGSSFIAGPQGELLAIAPTKDEVVISAKLNLKRADTLSKVWHYMRDRRVDAYDGLLKRQGEQEDENTTR